MLWGTRPPPNPSLLTLSFFHRSMMDNPRNIPFGSNPFARERETPQHCANEVRASLSGLVSSKLLHIPLRKYFIPVKLHQIIHNLDEREGDRGEQRAYSRK